MRAKEKQSGGLFFADVCVSAHGSASSEPLALEDKSKATGSPRCLALIIQRIFPICSTVRPTVDVME